MSDKLIYIKELKMYCTEKQYLDFQKAIKDNNSKKKQLTTADFVFTKLKN